MKRPWKKAGSILYTIIISIVLAVTIITAFFPDFTEKVYGFRFYTVLTGSMEPTIPTYALVFSRSILDKDAIKPGTIITFHANRLGDDIVLTHYLQKKQKQEDGRIRYYTVAENRERPDDYETYADDIIGAYVGHIPYLGKIPLFLHSKFAVYMLVEMAVIFLVNRIINYLLNRQQKKESLP